MLLARRRDFIKHNSPAIREQPGLNGISEVRQSTDNYDFTRNVARNALRVLLFVHLLFRLSPWYDCRKV